MPKVIDFHPKKSLLNLKFEKYQFSSEVIPITGEKSLSTDVLRQELSSGQDSWLEVKLFGFHNHLFKNPFDSSCWFCDKQYQVWQLKKDFTLILSHSFSPQNTVTTYNPTISFASDKIVVLTRGDNNLEVLVAKNPEEYTSFIIENVEPGVLLDSRELKNDSKLVVAMNCIVDVKGKKASKLVILFYCLKTINNYVESINFVQKQELIIHGSIEYVFIEASGDYINLLSQDFAQFTFDSLNKIQDTEENQLPSSEVIRIPKYSWSQDEESLTVWIKIPQKYKDSKAKVKVTPTTCSVSIEDEILVHGELQFRLEEDTAVWHQGKDTLKLDLMKHESGQMWNELLQGDTEGECLPNEALATEIHSRLSHLCSDQEQGLDSSGQPVVGFNSEQLEECDLQGKDNVLQRIHLSKHLTTHLAMLGTHNRVLFTQKLKSCQVLCTRHDHDGCVWQSIEHSHPEQWEMEHTNTFPGFGYVEASKSNKKFCISPPNCSFVAIIEHTRHGFVYEKPGTAAQIAKQRIIDLGPNTQPIMGAAAMDDFIILLTENKIYILKLS